MKTQEETDRQKGVHLQVGRYLLEQFSVPAFRSHVTVGLVDRDRIQFYHANRSVILVTSAINFSTEDNGDGLDKFIAIVIAFSRLSLRENGILHGLHGGLFNDNEKLPSNFIENVHQIQKGKELVLSNGSKKFKLTYGDVISHEPSLSGRATAVLHAKSKGYSNLVVKISWPGSKRVAEDVFLKQATDIANSSRTHKWAIRHLPKLVFAQSVTFDANSTHGMVASLFKDAKFSKGEYEYEERTLRIIVQERLHPLKTLTDPKEIAQVLLDVACGQHLLFSFFDPRLMLI